MSSVVIIAEGQSIIDIAIQHCGDVDKAIEIVAGHDPTGEEGGLFEALVAGQAITIQDEWVNSKITREILSNISTAE